MRETEIFGSNELLLEKKTMAFSNEHPSMRKIDFSPSIFSLFYTFRPCYKT